MSDFGRIPFDQPDVGALARSDRLLDALATRQPVEFSDFAEPGDEELAALLADWRDELRWPPASGLVSERQAVAALERGLADRRRTHRGLALVGSLAAAVLALGGFGTLVGGAQPGDALYGVHTMLFGEPPSVHDERVTLAAKTELEQVQQMITQGQWEQAQSKLAAVTDNVQTVSDGERKQDLIDEVNQLNAKVATHDPNATAPPAAPQPGVAPATTTTPLSSASPTSADQTTSTTSSATSSPPTSTSEATTTTTTSPAAASASTTPSGTTTTSTPTSTPASSTPPSSSSPTSAPTSTSSTSSSAAAASPSSVAPTATTTEPTTPAG